MPASYNKQSNPKSMSLGVQASAGLLGSIAGAIGEGWAFNKDKQGCVYAYSSGGVGLVAGVSAGVEYGVWWDNPADYAGKWWGVEGSLAAEFGAAVGIYFNDKMQFLGFLVVPQAGLEVELKYVEGETWVLGKFPMQADDDED